jgi:hypothetical protein
LHHLAVPHVDRDVCERRGDAIIVTREEQTSPCLKVISREGDAEHRLLLRVVCLRSALSTAGVST